MRSHTIAGAATALLALLAALGGVALAGAAGAHSPATAGPTTVFLPALSRPAPARPLAFQSFSDDPTRLGSAIVTAASNGVALRQLTDDAVPRSTPVWSPDGAKIAFTVTPGKCVTCPHTAYVMSADGGGVAPLTAEVTDTHSPAWSPDGKKIAFVGKNPATSLAEIFVITFGVAGLSPAFDPRAFSGYTLLGGPAWSPDGSRIAAVFRSAGTSYVCLSNSGGGAPGCLTRLPDVGTQLAWSPDSKAVAVEASLPSGEYGLFALPVDGSAPRQLTACAEGCGHPDWSPDGERILFTDSVGGTTSIFGVAADGTGRAPLLGEGVFGMAPRWSPDGSRVAFVGAAPPGERGTYVYSVSPDGTGLARVAPGTAPSWRP